MSRSGGSFPPLVGGVVALALGLRVWHVVDLASAPFFELKLGDAAYFHAWARQLAAGDWLGHEVFWYAPLYPYFLGAIYRTLGDDALVVRLVQALIGSASCGLLALAGREWFSARIGALAGAILAIYAPAIFYDGLLHKPVLAIFFLTLVLWCLGRASASGGGAGVGVWITTGLGLGGLVLTRENALVLVLPCILTAWCSPHRSRGDPPGGAPHESHRSGDTGTRILASPDPGRGGLRVVLLLTALAAVLLPVALRNQLVGGQFHLTAANFGDNFYKGNNPTAEGRYRPLRPGRGSPEYERIDATRLAEQALGRELSPAEVSRFWTLRALDYIRAEPLDWMRLNVRKLVLLANRLEWADSEDLYTHREVSRPLRITGLFAHLGLLLPLAACGMWIGRRERIGRVWPLLLMLVLYVASVVLFYVFGRYRYPVVPLLALFASAGLFDARAYLRRATFAQALRALGLFVAFVVLSNWPIDSTAVIRSGTSISIGNALSAEGRLDAALLSYHRAVELDPGNGRGYFNLGLTSAALGRPGEAERWYREALRVRPAHVKARINLAVALASGGRLAEAEGLLRTALEIEPHNVAVLGNLSRVAELRGDPHEAVRLARRGAEAVRFRDLWILERLEGACLAAGERAQALRAAWQAEALAREQGLDEQARQIAERVERYRSEGSRRPETR